jgi:hypothetical protein
VRAAVRAREKASMTRAAAWLEELGVGQYAQVLAKRSTAFGVTSDLTEVSLEKVGCPIRPPRADAQSHRCARWRKSSRGYRPSLRCSASFLGRATPAHIAVLRSRGLNGVRNSLALGRDAPADADRPRRRGDRMTMLFAAVHESACGPLRRRLMPRIDVGLRGAAEGHRRLASAASVAFEGTECNSIN